MNPDAEREFRDTFTWASYQSARRALDEAKRQLATALKAQDRERVLEFRTQVWLRRQELSAAARRPKHDSQSGAYHAS